MTVSIDGVKEVQKENKKDEPQTTWRVRASGWKITKNKHQKSGDSGQNNITRFLLKTGHCAQTSQQTNFLVYSLSAFGDGIDINVTVLMITQSKAWNQPASTGGNSLESHQKKNHLGSQGIVPSGLYQEDSRNDEYFSLVRCLELKI